MNFTVEDIVYPRTSTEIMDIAPPPTYNDATSIHKVPSESAIHQDLFSLLDVSEKPPQTSWLVRAEKKPSAFKLLTGPLLSNANNKPNDDPSRKRRYKVIYPPGYEDVYLHKSAWAAYSSTLPMYHVELFGRDRYEPEPIVILGPTEFEPETALKEARTIATDYLGRVFSNIELEVVHTTRFVIFCESEYFSWDWKTKTAAAKYDMRSFIIKARGKCIRDAGMVMRLEQILDFVGREEGGYYGEIIEKLKKKLKESSWRLNRLQI